MLGAITRKTEQFSGRLEGVYLVWEVKERCPGAVTLRRAKSLCRRSYGKGELSYVRDPKIESPA